MAYGIRFREAGRGTASCIDKLLTGAKPAELRVEQPIKVDLVITLKTVQALGLTVPPTPLFQAAEVIR